MIFLILLLIFVIRKDIAFNDPNTADYCTGFMIAGGLELSAEFLWLVTIV